MSSKNRKLTLIAVLLAVCLLAGGCSTSDTTTDAPVDFSVDIVVPYATTTPVPETANDGNASPLSIDADGNVTLTDTNWIDAGFSGTDLSEAANYYKQLRLGDSGTEVRNLQTRLKALEYYTGEVSGVFDSATEDAVKRFELTYGTMQTGIATVKLQGLLFAATAPAYNSNAYKAAMSGNYVTLQYGDTGTGVYALQERLKALGYPIANVTGIFDEDTAEAVRLFYVAYGLEESEIAIVALQKELFSENAKAYAPEGSSGAQFTLSLGNIGSLVTQLQEKLIGLGYLSGSASGTFDDATAEAIRALQRNLGLEETGMATPALQNTLLADEAPAANATVSGEDGTLRQGATGEEVTRLQERLIELGFTDVQVTGTFDDATAYAISLFQGEADLEQTGTASPSLIEFIYSDNANVYRKTEELLDSQPQTPAEGPEAVTLSLGATGEAVETLQARLKELEYLDEVSGEFDDATEAALKAFQTAIGVEATGTASPSMQVYLMSKAAPNTGIVFYDDDVPLLTSLSLGDSGDAVEELQKRLWERGFLLKESIEDSIGTFNGATQIAVANAQLAMGYPETDGVAGVEFQAFLFSKYGDHLNPAE